MASGGVKVVVVGGAGGIGQPLSLLLKQQLPAGSTLALYDVVGTLGAGADLSHVCTPVKVEAYLGDMNNPNNPEVDKAMSGADIVILVGGVPRKPGMTRDDLFKINAGIVRDVVNAIARNSPKALIAVVTNPVNSMVPVAAKVLQKHGVYDRNRLFGVSTLDIVRAQTFIGELKGVDPAAVHVDVLGGHSAETMLPILSHATAGGKTISFSDSEAAELTQRIADAGTVVVNAKQGAGSATLSMAYAGARFTMALLAGLQGRANVQEDAFVQVDGVEGLNWCGVRVELGKGGISRIFPFPALSAFEQQRLKEVTPLLKQNIDTADAFQV